MQIRILDEQHNLVAWELRSPLVKVLLGFLGGLLLAVGVLLFSRNALRWPFIGGAVTLALGAALFTALTTPLWERGVMERTPEGGMVQREQRWLLRREPVTWDVSLEALAGLRVTTQTVEETEGYTTTFARLCVRLVDSESLAPLTGWASNASVEALAAAFAKAARLPLESA